MEQDRILILGGGRSGIAMHRYCTAEFIPHDWIADTRLIRNPDKFATRFSVAVISPGIDVLRDPTAAVCKRRGIPVIGELEFAARRLPCPIAAITGTNGKTTVTRLVFSMLKKNGADVFLAGNGGVPLTAVVGKTSAKSVAVTEASSFMLETAVSFHARACCVTNLTPDHLDRHGSMAAYAAAKANVYRNCVPGDTVVLNADDEAIKRLMPPPPVAPVRFSLSTSCEAYADGNELLLDGKRLMSREDLVLKGDHNVANVLCAALVAYGMGVPAHRIAASAAMFCGVAHRVEFVGTDPRGVSYYNDSKATNIASVLVAIDAFGGMPLSLIVGGSDKGVRYDDLIRGLPKNCIAVIATGATAKAIAEAADRAGDGRVRIVPDFADAVRCAGACAPRGGAVLLSPACASFDAFKNYRERGDRFCALAEELGAKR